MKFFSSLPAKIAALLVLMLLLLLPVGSIMSLIHERSGLQEQVVRTISNSTSGAQTIIGPILAIPYEVQRRVQDSDKNWEIRTERSVAYFLPEKLDIKSRLNVEPRKIGIYQAQTYSGPVHFSGRIAIPAQASLLAEHIKIGEPFLSISIGDTRGIRNIDPIQLNGERYAVRPGAQVTAFESGIHAPVKLGGLNQPQALEFSFEIELQGTNSIAVAPVGESTSFSLTSNWPHPNFVGDFLPVTRNVTAQGFTAEWKSSWFANNMNTRLGKMLMQAHLSALPVFSTSLIQTVDQYQLNERSVKYAVLFIGLTFITFFLFEVLKGLRVHPVQYTLVGMALCLFYLLLLALSEHIGFNLAYLLASSSCVALITFYVSHVLHSAMRALGFGTLLGLLYASLWGLLQSEDNALLLGSGLLFCVLALIMVVTRKIDWYKLSKNGEADEENNWREDLPASRNAGL